MPRRPQRWVSGVHDVHRGGQRRAREGRAGAVDDETIRGAGNHGGKGGLRNGGEAAACLTVTTAASPALRPSDARGG
jgi:hypothetical protein